MVIKHLVRAYKCHSKDLAPYYMAVKQLIDDFDDVSISHIFRRFHNEANELAQATTGVYQRRITVQKRVLPLVRRRNFVVKAYSAEISEEDLQTPIIKFLKHPCINVERKIRRIAAKYVIVEGEPFQISFEDEFSNASKRRNP